MTFDTSGEGLAWFALRTKSNREAVVTEALLGRGLEAWCPRFNKGSGGSANKPVFPAYLFCRFNVWDRMPVVTVPGLLNIVSSGRIPLAVDNTEIESLRILVESQLPLLSHEYLQAGDSVKIINGPLTGAQGRIVRRQREHLVVSISLLQRSVAVMLQSEWLEKAA
jgi:transcription antitermination factor NusG